MQVQGYLEDNGMGQVHIRHTSFRIHKRKKSLVEVDNQMRFVLLQPTKFISKCVIQIVNRIFIIPSESIRHVDSGIIREYCQHKQFFLLFSRLTSPMGRIVSLLLTS